MRLIHLIFIVALLLIQCKPDQKSAPTYEQSIEIQVVSTALDGSYRMTPQKTPISEEPSAVSMQIGLALEDRLQRMDGFGFALTGGSAQHLMAMSTQARDSLLQELFGMDGESLGMSYIRISIGASDLDSVPFSYNDLPKGKTDPEMKQFDLGPDRPALIPVLLEILKIQPTIKIMASPWSPPVWMKDNGSTKGGSLLKEHYDAYALYFVKYLKAMEAEGIKIHSVTPQNEPLHPGNNPSMYMSAEDQAEFIGLHLGPAFKANRVDAKIIVYDHNADRPDYPLTILADSLANPFVTGSGFHLYGGDIEALSEVHEAFPDKELYFTEQWYGAKGNFEEDLEWHFREVVIGGSRNWCKAIIEWNLSSNPELQPHTDGGCSQCLGAISIDGDKVKRNAGYYTIGHASRFVFPGSIRLQSNTLENLPYVAFLGPTTEVVILALNPTEADQRVNLDLDGFKTSFVLPKRSISSVTLKFNIQAS